VHVTINEHTVTENNLYNHRTPILHVSQPG